MSVLQFRSNSWFGNRPLETIIPVLVVLSSMLSSKHKVILSSQYSLRSCIRLLVCFTLALSVKREKMRWQQAPLTISFMCLFFQKIPFVRLIGISFATLTVLLCRCFPVTIFRLRNCDNLFNVGTFDYMVNYCQCRNFNDSSKLLGKRNINDADAPLRTIGRCFYPTNDVAKHTAKSHVPYLYRRCPGSMESSYINFGLPRWLHGTFPLTAFFRYWNCVTVSAQDRARLATHSMGVKQCPVVIISHGLKATREMSTSLSLRLASLGCVVFCIEHLDGSAAVARFPDNTSYDQAAAKAGVDHYQMKYIQDTKGEEAYAQARMKQCSFRAKEIQFTIDLIRWLSNRNKQDGSQKNDEACFDTNANVSQYQGFTVLVDGATDDAPASGLCSDDAVLKQFENRLDVSNITLAGHSFGGATVLTFLARAHHMKLSSSQNDLQRKKSDMKQLVCTENTDMPCKTCNFHVELPSPFKAVLVLDPAMCWIPKTLWPYFAFYEDRHDNECNIHKKVHSTDNESNDPKILPSPPLLAIFSEDWHSKKWFWPILKDYLVKLDESLTTAKSKIVYLIGSTHVSLCDMGILFPEWLGKRVNMFSNKSNSRVSPDSQLNAINEECVSFLREHGVLKHMGKKVMDCTGSSNNMFHEALTYRLMQTIFPS